MSVRDVLLLIFAGVWAAVVVTTVIRTGQVPAELWAVLGVGVGALLAAFRTDDKVGRRTPDDKPEDGK